MSDRDEHLEVLRAMWGEMKTLNARINTTNERLDEMREDLGARIDATRDFLGARIDATNERLDATNERLDGVVVELREGVALARLDRKRLERLERRVDALERRDR